MWLLSFIFDLIWRCNQVDLIRFEFRHVLATIVNLEKIIVRRRLLKNRLLDFWLEELLIVLFSMDSVNRIEVCLDRFVRSEVWPFVLLLPLHL